MTREELREHCEKQIEMCEFWAIGKGEKPSGKVYEEHKLILELLEQEPKTGHWIVQPSNKEQGERDFIWWKCSECGQVIFSETEKDRKEFHAFCGRCGADMRGNTKRKGNPIEGNNESYNCENWMP